MPMSVMRIKSLSDLPTRMAARNRSKVGAVVAAGETQGISGGQTGTGQTRETGSGNDSAAQVGFVMLPWPHADLSPNARVHYMARSRAAKKYRMQCYLMAKAAGISASGPIKLAIEFRPPDRRNRDDDNLVASFKSGRDGLADALGINDNLFSMLPPTIGEPIPGGGVSVRLLKP